MKKASIMLTIVGFVVVGGLLLPHIVYADCGSAKTDCCIGGDKSKTIGVTTFSMCWSWKYLQCRPCHGGGEWSYLAAWCNSNYPRCKNECWACFDDNNCCFDKQGNDHNCYN